MKPPTTKKAIKKENLKKRQKYDPRKAIEEAKKKEENKGDESKPNAKSAFPDGMLVNNDNSSTNKNTNKRGAVEDRIRS